MELDKEKIREEIKNLKEELDDVELEKHMFFQQKGLHISGKKVLSQIEKYDQEISQLKEKIQVLENQLK